MKKVISTLTILLMLVSLYGKAPNDFKKFYRQHKHDKGVMNIWLPSFVIKAASFSQDSYVKKFAHSTSKLRIMIKEENAEGLFDKLNSSLSNADYKDLIYVKDGAEDVRIVARIKNKAMKEILIIVNDNDSLVAVQLIGNYHINDLKELARELS